MSENTTEQMMVEAAINAHDYEPINVKVTDIKFGDLWGGTREITKVDTKTKYTYVTFSSGDTERLDNEGTAFVWRETEASQNARYEAARRVRRNGRIADWFGRYEARRATNKVHAKMDALLTEHPGALVDDYLLGQFIEAQASDKVASRVHTAIEAFTLREPGRGPFAEIEDLVGLAEYMAEEFRRSLLQVGGLSRSTSVVANVMADADRAAEADYLRHYQSTWF